MINRFCESANLKALISDNTTPTILKPIMSLIQAVTSSQYQGTLLTDIKAQEEFSWTAERWSSPKTTIPIALEERRLFDRYLQPNTAIESIQSLKHASATYAGIGPKYRADWTKGRNSTILYEAAKEVHAGRILQVVLPTSSTSAEDALLLVEPYESLSEEDRHLDPYRSMNELGCFLVYGGGSASRRVIRTKDIIAHAARTPYRPVREEFAPSKPCIILVSLDRVSLRRS